MTVIASSVRSRADRSAWPGSKFAPGPIVCWCSVRNCFADALDIQRSITASSPYSSVQRSDRHSLLLITFLWLCFDTRQFRNAARAGTRRARPWSFDLLVRWLRRSNQSSTQINARFAGPQMWPVRIATRAVHKSACRSKAATTFVSPRTVSRAASPIAHHAMLCTNKVSSAHLVDF